MKKWLKYALFELIAIIVLAVIYSIFKSNVDVPPAQFIEAVAEYNEIGSIIRRFFTKHLVDTFVFVFSFLTPLLVVIYNAKKNSVEQNLYKRLPLIAFISTLIITIIMEVFFFFITLGKGEAGMILIIFPMWMGGYLIGLLIVSLIMAFIIEKRHKSMAS